MPTHSSTLAWKIPWTEEPGRLQSMGSHRVRHNWSDLAAAAEVGSVNVCAEPVTLREVCPLRLPTGALQEQVAGAAGCERAGRSSSPLRLALGRAGMGVAATEGEDGCSAVCCCVARQRCGLLVTKLSSEGADSAHPGRQALLSKGLASAALLPGWALFTRPVGLGKLLLSSHIQKVGNRRLLWGLNDFIFKCIEQSWHKCSMNNSWSKPLSPGPSLMSGLYNSMFQIRQSRSISAC